MNIKIDNSWKVNLTDEFEKDYFKKLTEFLVEEYKNYTIFPPPDEIFTAFNLCNFENTKVVILGQDPYHGDGQAHGLSFSVKENIKMPPSLINIFKELNLDINKGMPKSGNLTKWAQQGVLLLNATLTVRKDNAGSHQNHGWEIFTDKVIQLISEKKKNLVFILWGAFAQKKAILIDENKHLILSSPHPSPLSAHKGFFNNNHFSKTNNYLKNNNINQIEW
jgi:uracil-DNA glycosylase